jgi:hypothetical protein
MPGSKLQHAEPGQRVARVVRPAQHGEQVLHVRGLEELQAAVLHERDLAPRELDLEQVAVARAAEQDRLPAQAGAASRRCSTCRQMYSACDCRSSTVT